MKAFSLVLFAALAACAAAPAQVAAPPSTAEQIIEDRFDSLAALVVLSPDGHYRPYCSGVFVRAYVVTAAHCVIHRDGGMDEEVEVAVYRDFDEVTGEWSTSRTYWTTLVWEAEDVAILQPQNAVSRAFHGSVSLASENLHRGEEVTVLGHPRGYKYFFSRGEVVTPARMIDNMPFTLINAPGYRGMSGGPALNENGELVGLVAFGWWGEAHVQGLVTRNSLARALAHRGISP